VRRDPNRYPVGFFFERLQRYYPIFAPVMRFLARVTPQRVQAFGIQVHYGSMKVMAYRAGTTI